MYQRKACLSRAIVRQKCHVFDIFPRLSPLYFSSMTLRCSTSRLPAFLCLHAQERSAFALAPGSLCEQSAKYTHIISSGHIGTYLIPRLAAFGYEIVNISKVLAKPYLPHAAWHHVSGKTCDRQAQEAAGTFGAMIAEIKPDVVIDLICFQLGSARHLVKALRGHIQLFFALRHDLGAWSHAKHEIPRLKQASAASPQSLVIHGA